MSESKPQKNPEIEVLRAFIGAALNQGVRGYRADWLLESLHRIEEQLEAAKEDRDRCGRMLLDVEGSILAYWTDIPEAECERLRVTIRHVLETLPSFEADLAAANSNPASEPEGK